MVSEHSGVQHHPLNTPPTNGYFLTAHLHAIVMCVLMVFFFVLFFNLLMSMCLDGDCTHVFVGPVKNNFCHLLRDSITQISSYQHSQ